MVTDKPQRIQLSRKRGWRMPPNTVKVCRPSDFGNPFRIAKADGKWIIAGLGHTHYRADKVEAQAVAVLLFRRYCPPGSTLATAARVTLRGKNLGCWCAEGSPCHGDYLLWLANG